MWSSCLLLLAVAAAAHAQRHPIHIICVPHVVAQACEKMAEQAQEVSVNIKCLPARDRVDCLYKVKDHEADFEVLEPEDMFIALQLSNETFSVFQEIRTKEEKNAEFRYEGVAVIHKDMEIKSIKELKGKKSCHTGVGRNVGYKIPITKLTKMGILGPLNDQHLSPRENELKALSSFFSEGCLVGKWSPHPETNARWKKTYSNLCQLCVDPVKCDYPDENSGYEGALRCLAKAGGEVAWTKVIYVKKFFGLPYGTQPARQVDYNPKDYAYLCPDSTKRPILGQPCIWAARPWPGFIASTQIDDADLKKLKAEIISLNNLGEEKHADWLAKVLLINDKTLAVENTPRTPLEYLEKARYLDVIERDVLEPRRHVRLCVRSDIEMEKCELFSSAAYSRDIRPSVSCVKSDNCVQSLLKREADVLVADALQAIQYERDGLRPLLNEQYNNESQQSLIAVVKEDSKITSNKEIKGKKVCLLPKDSSGYYGVLRYLINNNLITDIQCPFDTALTEFFTQVNSSDDPEKCLVDGQGEVAFVPRALLEKHSGCRCLGSGAQEECASVDIPPRMVLASKDLSDVQTDEVRQSLLSAGNLYGSHPDLFRLFGDFNNRPDIIFSNYATGLVATPEHLNSYDAYRKMINSCPA